MFGVLVVVCLNLVFLCIVRMDVNDLHLHKLQVKYHHLVHVVVLTVDCFVGR